MIRNFGIVVFAFGFCLLLVGCSAEEQDAATYYGFEMVVDLEVDGVAYHIAENIRCGEVRTGGGEGVMTTHSTQSHTRAVGLHLPPNPETGAAEALIVSVPAYCGMIRPQIRHYQTGEWIWPQSDADLIAIREGRGVTRLIYPDLPETFLPLVTIVEEPSNPQYIEMYASPLAYESPGARVTFNGITLNRRDELHAEDLADMEFSWFRAGGDFGNDFIWFYSIFGWRGIDNWRDESPGLAAQADILKAEGRAGVITMPEDGQSWVALIYSKERREGGGYLNGMMGGSVFPHFEQTERHLIMHAIWDGEELSLDLSQPWISRYWRETNGLIDDLFGGNYRSNWPPLVPFQYMDEIIQFNDRDQFLYDPIEDTIYSFFYGIKSWPIGEDMALQGE